MNIVTVCMAKNEEALIESFVRYSFTFSDYILIFNHNSTDGTSDILSALHEEYGDKLVLFFSEDDPSFVKNQPVITDRMIKYAVETLQADFVLPIDTDEFPILEGADNNSIRDFLTTLSKDKCYQVYWRLYAPPADGLLNGELFAPLAFNRRRPDITTRWTKSIISGECYREKPIHVTMGNHGMYHEDGSELPTVVNLTPPLYYAHFPCRGLEHYISKVANNWPASFIRPNWNPGESEHYRTAYNRLLLGETPSAQELDWYSLTGGGLTGETADEIINKIEVCDPRSFFPEIELKYTGVLSKNKDKYILLMESMQHLAENYRSIQELLKQKNNELQLIYSSKAWKFASFLRRIKNAGKSVVGCLFHRHD